MSESSGSHVLGEAAHITAAAPGGPRYDETMSAIERRSIGNGVWMCRHHARLVDVDESNYSAATLRQWKEAAERRAGEALQRGVAVDALEPLTTLVALGHDVVFYGSWIKGGADEWHFDCQSMLHGTLAQLRDYLDVSCSTADKFVVVESQGDGRLLKENCLWEQTPSGLRVVLAVEPRATSVDPSLAGTDIALDADGDLDFSGGSMKLVTGVESAIQRLSTAMSTERGEWFLDADVGSKCGPYYRLYQEQPNVLARLLALEFSRLATIPGGADSAPPLNFVWRVESVRISDTGLDANRNLRVEIHLVWANRTHWSGTVPIFIREHPPS